MAARRCGVGWAVLAMQMRLAGTESHMAPTLIDRFDAAVGDGIEHAMIRHHLRRLRRLDQLEALVPVSEGLWAQTASPPREGNALEVLVDGANALPEMAE